MISSAEITAWLGLFLWPLFRCGTALWLTPMFGSSTTPRHVRMALAAALAILIGPELPKPPAVDPLSPESVLLVFEQVLIGATFGLITQLLFTTFTLAGQIISMQMGLSMAVMNDPANGPGVPLMGKWLQTLTFLLFLAMDGHLVVIRVLMESFYTLPIGSGLFPNDFMDLALMGSWLFSGALLVSLPAVFSMLLVNLCFGVMARSAPQLNIFALGFPMTMIFGMLTLFLVLISMPTVFLEITELALGLLRNYARA